MSKEYLLYIGFGFILYVIGSVGWAFMSLVYSWLNCKFISIFIIVLSSLDFKAVRYLKTAINEVVYRSSFIVSIPENFIKNSLLYIKL